MAKHGYKKEKPKKKPKTSHLMPNGKRMKGAKHK